MPVCIKSGLKYHPPLVFEERINLAELIVSPSVVLIECCLKSGV